MTEEAEVVKTSFTELKADQFPQEEESCWRTKDGSYRWIAWSRNVLVDDQNEIEYVVNTGIDITTRKRAEQRLVTQHALTKVLAESGDLEGTEYCYSQNFASSLRKLRVGV